MAIDAMLDDGYAISIHAPVKGATGAVKALEAVIM